MWTSDGPRVFRANLGSQDLGEVTSEEAEALVSKFIAEPLLLLQQTLDSLGSMTTEEVQNFKPIVIFYSGFQRALMANPEERVDKTASAADLDELVKRYAEVSGSEQSKIPAKGAARLAAHLIGTFQGREDLRILITRRLGPMLLGWHSALLLSRQGQRLSEIPSAEFKEIIF